MEAKKKVKSLVRLTNHTCDEIEAIFQIADDIQVSDRYKNILTGRTVVMFFPESSIRTRVTFEKGIHLLGGQSILFPPETLDKKEAIRDVVGYLNNWADAAVVRHKKIDTIEGMASYADFPVINAMTDVNHPCEVLADLYTLSKRREDYLNDKYLFVGRDGNIGRAYKEAADVMGFSFRQSCPAGYEIPGVEVIPDVRTAAMGMDIICTDSLPASALSDFKEYRITSEIMDIANPDALLNPCPPFYRGEEVSAEVIDCPYFVGYEFKKHLLEVQMAVLIYCITN